MTYKNLLRFFRKKSHKKEHMKQFSSEYLDKLIADHKLVSSTITQIQITGFGGYASRHGVDNVHAALGSLKAKKVELEGMIDVLTEYLN